MVRVTCKLCGRSRCISPNQIKDENNYICSRPKCRSVRMKEMWKQKKQKEVFGTYTVHLLKDSKIEIDFLEPLEKESYVHSEFLKFFKKHKKKITILSQKGTIQGIICDWKLWGMFMWGHLGFQDNIYALCSILNELYIQQMDDYVDAFLGKGQIIKPDDRTIVFERPDEHEQNLEIRRKLDMYEPTAIEGDDICRT